jgi:hypothetical protein
MKDYTPAQLEMIIDFAQTEIRSRFDNTHSDFEAITIIEEARLLGFVTLGNEMITDLATSQENMSEKFIRNLIAKHEERNHRDYQPEPGENYIFQMPIEPKEKRA